MVEACALAGLRDRCGRLGVGLGSHHHLGELLVSILSELRRWLQLALTLSLALQDGLSLAAACGLRRLLRLLVLACGR